MRYPAHQKSDTHKQIVDTAAREFRGRGLQGIGIADLMSQVGLTQGGFYAHFKDRDALVAEATACAATQSLCLLMEATAAAAPGHELEAIIDFYLSTEHRDDPGGGCFLPAFAAELARQPRVVRSTFTASARINLAKIARFMPGNSVKAKQAQAMMLISAMAGAVLLARATDDVELSDLMLASVRSQLLALYGSPRA